MTLSMTWMTPLLANTSAVTTFEVPPLYSTFTLPPLFLRVIFSPLRVATSPFLTFLAGTKAPTTWLEKLLKGLVRFDMAIEPKT